MLDFEINQRIARLQERVIRSTLYELKSDGGHKSSEAAISVSMHIPNMFQQEAGIEWSIEVYSYVLGPNRRHYFLGKTIGEAVSKAEDAVNSWCTPSEFRMMDEMCGNTDAFGGDEVKVDNSGSMIPF